MDQQEKSDLIEIQAKAVQKGLRNYETDRRKRRLLTIILGPIIFYFIVSNLFQFFVLGPLQTQRENGTLKDIDTSRF